MWHLLVADRQCVCVRAKLWPAVSFALPGNPLAQKRGGTKHIRDSNVSFRGRAHAQPKTVWFTRLEARVGTGSLAEPRLLALIWPEAIAQVASSPRPFSERVELDGEPMVTRLCKGCAVRT